MRILFSFHEGPGHYNPLVPLAKLAVAGGHTVAFSADPKRVGLPEADGFMAFPTGIDPYGSPESVAIEERYNAASPPGREREDALIRDGFGYLYPHHKAIDLIALGERWRPDIIVWDEASLGAPIAAERLGLPHVSVLVLAAGSLLRHDLIADGLNRVRAEHGLSPDSELAMLSRHLVLSPFPDGFRDPAFPLPPTARTIRPLLAEPPDDERLPDWAADLSDRPVVYFSLGTAFGRAALPIFRRVVPALAELPITLIVTVGRHITPDDLGPQPDHVHVASYISQALLLPRVALFVSHAGSGSIMGALTHGVPLALIPRGADQPENAARCEALGVGRVVGHPDVLGPTVRDTVAAMLTEPGCRDRARTMAAEIRRLPDADHALRLIEAVVRSATAA